MKKNHLVKYLLISPSLPVGGFCYSEGLESYLKIKNLQESDQIRDLITNELKIGQIRIDAKCLIEYFDCLLYTSPSPRDLSTSRMPSSA